MRRRLISLVLSSILSVIPSKSSEFRIQLHKSLKNLFLMNFNVEKLRLHAACDCKTLAESEREKLFYVAVRSTEKEFNSWIDGI